MTFEEWIAAHSHEGSARELQPTLREYTRRIEVALADLKDSETVPQACRDAAELMPRVREVFACYLLNGGNVRAFLLANAAMKHLGARALVADYFLDVCHEMQDAMGVPFGSVPATGEGARRRLYEYVKEVGDVAPTEHESGAASAGSEDSIID